jgi:hypothetical protein
MVERGSRGESSVPFFGAMPLCQATNYDVTSLTNPFYLYANIGWSESQTDPDHWKGM